MVDKIIITPEKIRGLGNVILPRELEDYSKYQSNLEENTETVDGLSTTVYTLSYNPVNFNITIPNSITIGQSINISGLVSSHDDPLNGLDIEIYNGGTLIATVSTDSEGEFSYTYTPETVGTYNIKCVYSGNSTYGRTESDSFNVTVNRIVSTITCQGNGTSSYFGTQVPYGTPVVISGECNIPNAELSFYQDYVLIGTVTADSNGAYSKTLNNLSVKDYYNFTVNYKEDATHTECAAETWVSVVKADLTLEISLDNNEIILGESVTINGIVNVGSRIVRLFDGASGLAAVFRANEDGTFSYTYTPQYAGSFIIAAYATGDSNYNSATVYNSDLYVREILYAPEFTGSDNVILQGSNSNAHTASDGVATFKGAVLAEGWDNSELWELSVDIAYLNGLRYTGLILLTSTSNPFSGWGIRNWEGPVTGNPLVDSGSANYTKTPDTTLTDLPDGVSITSNPTVGWYTLHMKKTSATTLEVWKNNDTANKVIYEWSELSLKSTVTVGGTTNMAYESTQDSFGSVYMRNLIVKSL